MTILMDAVDLSELDMDAAPPCDGILTYPMTGAEEPCEAPSVVRVTGTCSGCGRYRAAKFLCALCYEYLRRGIMVCYTCSGTDIKFQET